MTGPADGLALQRPDFAVRLEVPPDWLLLDLHAADAGLAASPVVAALDPGPRRELLALLAPLLEDARARGVSAVAVHRAAGGDGPAFTGSLTVGWHQSGPELASPSLLAAVAGATSLVRARVPAGPVVLRRGVRRDRRSLLAPDGDTYLVQGLLGVTGTSWVGVLTATAGHVEHAPLVERVLRQVLLRLRVVPPGVTSSG